MKTVFANSGGVQCIFTDEGLTFSGNGQEVYYPYGSLDTVKISLMGVLQASCRTRVCSFAVDRKDRAKAKEMIQYAR